MSAVRLQRALSLNVRLNETPQFGFYTAECSVSETGPWRAVKCSLFSEVKSRFMLYVRHFRVKFLRYFFSVQLRRWFIHCKYTRATTTLQVRAAAGPPYRDRNLTPLRAFYLEEFCRIRTKDPSKYIVSELSPVQQGSAE